MKTRYTERYIEGKLVSSIPYQISDNEALIEAIDVESRKANDNALKWYSEIEKMSAEDLREVVKMLCGRHIAEHRSEYITQKEKVK